jgi:alpha-1,3-rhamnosyl/mannosyltransferase
VTLRVGTDARCLNTNFVRGIGEYLLPLVRHLSAMHDVEWIFYGHRPDLPFFRPEGAEASKVILHDVPGNRFHAWEQMWLPFRAMLDRVQVLHCVATTMPWWQPVPMVVTIHDTIPWQTGESMPGGLYRDRMMPDAFRRCAKIITISDHSRTDILQLWPELADKIRVIRHGVSDSYLHCVPGPLGNRLQEVGISQPYLLYLGGTTPRKRADWTLKLYQALGRTDIGLVMCGIPEAAHESYRQHLKPEFRASVVFAPFLAAEDMPLLYQNALAVLYPTLYEGFGRPALDAQAVGTPIVMSNVSSLRELVGPTSIALQPDDRNGWLQACNAVIERRLASPAPDASARDWATQFNWRNSAEAHWQVYREAAARGRVDAAQVAHGSSDS